MWAYLLCFVGFTGQQVFGTYPHDPYLVYQPHFAFSLPVQILLTGITTALVAVLLIHLLFTAQYHWPLAKLNYGLQLSGVVTLLVSLIATLCIILNMVHHDSRQWPYMLQYVAVQLPPNADDEEYPPARPWSTFEILSWYLMQSLTCGLAHITHIQFLTLLYPSKMEARLIFLLLGPLAVASSAMVFTSLSTHPAARDLGDAIRGVCNAALSILFTASLFIWGFILHRASAWRTDGGTAAFGAGACTLAVLSTAINFVSIPEDKILWLPSMLWAVVLWQSFLGWWWWVGSGMGIDEVQEMLEKEQKRKEARRRKRAKKSNSRAARLERIRRHDQGLEDDDGRGSSGTAGGGSVVSRVLSTLSRGDLSRRKPTRTGTEDEPDGIELSTRPANVNSIPTLQLPIDHASTSGTILSSSSTTSREHEAPSTTLGYIGAFFSTFPGVPFVRRFARKLRRAHKRAARAQAIERVSTSGGTSGGDGWGLGNFGLREREEAERRIRMFQEQRRRDELLNEEGAREGSGEDGSGSGSDMGSGEDAEGRDDRPVPNRIEHSSPQPPTFPPLHPISLPPQTQLSSSLYPPAPPDPADPPLAPPGQTFWWWGPMRKWRLQDRTVY